MFLTHHSDGVDEDTSDGCGGQLGHHGDEADVEEDPDLEGGGGEEQGHRGGEQPGGELPGGAEEDPRALHRGDAR